LIRYIFRFRKKFGFPDLSKPNHLRFSDPVSDKDHHFAVMMGWDLYKCLPYFLVSNHHKSIYLFDAWPRDHEIIEHFVNFFHIDFVFVSSSGSCEMLRKRIKRSEIHWVPEGINPDEYRQVPYDQKNIDLLAVGRRFDRYHEKIVDYFRGKQGKYLYEKIKGEIIFPTRNEFIEGLAHTKISICVPSNITHPERSDNIETMTIRYLQSIISKCLVLGHAPAEMVELFGYNPVIEIDMKQPVEQLLDILNNFNNYQSFIEKNYQEVIKHHTWQHRWEQIKQIYLEGLGQKKS
jgi:glycosyltransferase involved in cell wall biosynthesis